MKTVRVQINDPRIIKKLCKKTESTEIIVTETIVKNQIKNKVEANQVKIVCSCDKFSKELKKGNLANLLSEEEKKVLKFALEEFNGKIVRITKNQQNYVSYSPKTKKESKNSINSSEKKLTQKVSALQNRKCVICGNNQWGIQNPQLKNSIIQCQNCGHIELLIS
jgi:hypothetical protein